MKIQHIIPLFLLAACCAVGAQTTNASAEPESIKLDSHGIPIGTLGFPVGNYLTIEGANPKWYDHRGKFVTSVLVDTVNGNKLTKSIAIEVHFVHDKEYLLNQTNFDSYSIIANTNYERFIFKGYETLGVYGEPPAYKAAAKESGQKLEPFDYMQQPLWHLDYSFEVMSIVSPK